MQRLLFVGYTFICNEVLMADARRHTYTPEVDTILYLFPGSGKPVMSPRELIIKYSRLRVFS